MFWDLITRIEAQEMLKALTIQDWSHMKKDKRSSLHRKLHKQAFPEDHKAITLEEYMKQSGGGLGG